MIYITASTGIFALDPATGNTIQVMSNKTRPGFFSKRSHGFFGICKHAGDNQIIVASREKLGTPKSGKPTTDTGLHAIDPVTNTYQTIGYVKDVHDVHQIDCYRNTVLLTDTGKNRIVAYDINSKQISCILNIGTVRDDVHHINAVTVVNDRILVGLNNRGERASEILHLPLSLLDDNSNIADALEHAIEIVSLAPYTNTHDIEPCNDSYLVCSSHDSVVIDSKTVKPVITSDKWVRGITCENDYIWVGQSHYAKRSKRHSKSLDGTVLKVNRATMEIENIITIPGTGQINDLQYYNPES